jgi:hypothetical protein
MKFLSKSLVLFFVLLTCNTDLPSQIISDQPFIAQSNASGEETIREIGMIAGDVKNKGERLFVIFRLSTTEAERLNNVRLMTTKWKLSTMGLQEPKVVFAEGERIKGEGRIEFYLGSNLRLVVLARRNQMPNLTCCEDYTPPVRRKIRKRKN